MLRILTLGGLTAKSADRPSAILTPRLQGLGLLARLAAAGERGLSRDKLIAYFWPERDERSALHSLSQALHRLRSDVGVDELLLGTRILRLDPRHVSSDVGDLEEARGSDDRRVVELYAGPFLDGIFFSGAPEFERWMEEERRRLAAVHATAVKRLAVAAARDGNHDEAARWWQRLVAVDPLDGRVARGLVDSLLAAGDDAGALREARFHQSLVRSELQREADERIVTFIEQRERHHAQAPSLQPSPAPPSQHVPDDMEGLTAVELCARARQCFFTFSAEGLAAGVRYAERAILLAPGDAQSHATHGWLLVLQSQAFNACALREQARASCRRAMQLDPMLADAPLALAWAAQLDERFDEGAVLARRGVALDPAFFFAHSVLAFVALNHGFRTGRWDRCAEAAEAFRSSLRIHPRDPHALMALAGIHTAGGQYQTARDLLERAVALEESPAGEVPMIAARTLLGLVELREGRLVEARACFERAMKEYANAPQIFASYIHALTLCALADLERLAGRHGEAVSYYARARAMLDTMPGLIGSGYLAVRLETRLAAALRPLRMRPQEERYRESALALTRTRTSYSFNWCLGVSEAELHYDWAVYHASCADRDAMLAALRDAVTFGWREVALLDIEPAFAFCRADPDLEHLRGEIRRRPALPAPHGVPRMTSSLEASRASYAK